MTAKQSVQHGKLFPFDACDAWWAAYSNTPPPSRDWMHLAIRGILADLKDRRGIKQAFVGIDENTRIEIVNSLIEIIEEVLESEKLEVISIL
jgi:hypothetical protein